MQNKILLSVPPWPDHPHRLVGCDVTPPVAHRAPAQAGRVRYHATRGSSRAHVILLEQAEIGGA